MPELADLAVHGQLGGNIDHQMAKACGQILARSISYINHTRQDRQHCYVGDNIAACKHKVVPGRIFCRFKNLRWSVMCIRTTNIRPDVLDVQETYRRFSQQCRVRNFARRRLENGRDTNMTQVWDCVLETFSLSSAGTLSVNVANVIFLFILTITCHLIWFTQHPRQLHSCQDVHF